MSRAQELALAALARQAGDVDDAALSRARADSRAEGASLVAALVEARALSVERVTQLRAAVGKRRFRCTRCPAEMRYEDLARLDELLCERCFAPLEPLPEAPAGARSGPLSLRPVERLGPYVLKDVIGRGSMGVVHRARKEGDPRDYAVKLMKLGETDPVLVARFERESETAARVEHPNVVRVFDKGEDQGCFYYAMELCRGQTLQKRIAEGPIPPQVAARLVRDMADAAALAHHVGVVHRDLKPANVILDAVDGRPRITDFGLARDALANQNLTRTGDTIGTPYYMSPEQVRAERDVDGRADVYALGVMLYECLAGQRPFQSRNPAELAREILTGARKPLREIAPNVPAGLEAIAMKAFSVARPARYATADELVEDLDRFLRGERPHALPQATSPARRRTLILAAWVGGALLFAAGAGVHVARRWSEAERARAAEALERERAAAAEAKKAADERTRRDLEGMLATAEKASRERRSDAFDTWRRVRAAGGGAGLIELRFAQFLIRRNHIAEALGALRPLAAATALTPPQVLELRLALAEALLRSRPPAIDAARDELGKLAGQDGGGARAELARARLAALEGRPDEAARLAESSLRMEELPQTYALLARLLGSGYEPARAVPHYLREALDSAERSRGDERAQRALRYADRAVVLAPDDVDAIAARSLVRVDLHICRFYAHDSMPDQPEYLAFMEARRKDLDDAIELATTHPDARALTLRGRYRFFFPKEGSARADLDAALAQDPRDVEALVYRAETILEHERGDPLPDLRAALDVDERAALAVARHLQLFRRPTIDWALRAEGLRLKERAESRIRLNTARVDARLARARPAVREALRAAYGRARLGDTADQLLPAYRKAIELAPDDPVPLVELGRMLMGRSRLDEALDAFAKAAALGAERTELGLLRAETLARDGRGVEGRVELIEVERRSEGTRRLVAGSLLARLDGDLALSRERARRAVVEVPDDPSARLAYAVALLSGPDPEPDAATAQALWGLTLDGKVDADCMHVLTHAAGVAGLMLPRPGDEMREVARLSLERGYRELDPVAPAARFHVKTALFLLGMPWEGARSLGRSEVEAARRVDAEGLEKLRRGSPALDRALGR